MMVFKIGELFFQRVIRLSLQVLESAAGGRNHCSHLVVVNIAKHCCAMYVKRVLQEANALNTLPHSNAHLQGHSMRFLPWDKVWGQRIVDFRLKILILHVNHASALIHHSMRGA